LRPVGAALSPNGFAFNDDESLLSLELCSKIVNIDKENSTVTVQAGCTVEKLAKELYANGLTMMNFASISEQQIGG